MDDDIVVLEHLTSLPKKVVQNGSTSIGPMHGLDRKRASKLQRRRVAAEKAAARRSHEGENNQQCEKYLREFYVNVSTRPSDDIISTLAKNVGRPISEVVKWFTERTMPEAFDAEMTKLITKIWQIQEFTPARIELEKMHDGLLSGPKTLIRIREAIKKCALKMNLDPDEVAEWLAEEDNYRDAKKRDLLSMNLAIYGRRAEFATDPSYGVKPGQPSMRKSLPFYSVFPIERIQQVHLNGHEKEMPIEIPQPLFTPKSFVPIAPETLRVPIPMYGVPNPSYVTPFAFDLSFLTSIAANSSYVPPIAPTSSSVTPIVPTPSSVEPIAPTPSYVTPIAPTPSSVEPSAPTPSYVAPKKSFSIDSILATDLLRDVAASHPSNETIKLAMQVLGIQTEFSK